MSLRTRLTLALVAVVALGLVVSDVATYAALRSYLLRRVDQQVQAATDTMARCLLAEGGDCGFGPGGRASLPPPGTYAQLYDPSGNPIRQPVVVTYGGTTLALPNLPSNAGSSGSRFWRTPVTVGAVGDGHLRYRAVAAPVPLGPGLSGYTEVVAIPMTEMGATLRRLLSIAGLATLAVLAGMALLSWVMVRRELRPLERVGETAGAIAAGDLSRRVDTIDPRTEVGRLGLSLNAMLSQIEAAMDERRASEEALRRFLADASHELRTPLTSIRGYAELFRRGAGATQADTALAMRRIEQESQRMGVLVDDLLFLERAGQGRPIERQPVDLVPLVTDAVHDARAVDGSRQIDLDAPSALEVLADEARLRQVFANLMSNALEHTPEGTQIKVRVTAEDGWAVASVQDQGPGIASEHLSHVFEPFYRADPARGRTSGEGKVRGSGTGLGLAIVAAVAEAHGGSIGASSEPEAGTTFTLRIPVARDAPATGEPPTAEEAPAVEEPTAADPVSKVGSEAG